MYLSSIICLLYHLLFVAALQNHLSQKVWRNTEEFSIRNSLLTYTNSYEALQQELLAYHRTSITILPRTYGLEEDSLSDLSKLLANRSSLFDNSQTLDPSQFEGNKVFESKQFESLLPLDVINVASNVIEEMKRLAQIMMSYNMPITCRLALMQGVRCPQWHEDYIKLRLIKAYFGPGTDWVDPGDKVVRATNWINAQLDRPLTVPDEKIQHAEEGDVLVLAGRRHESCVPVLHRSPVSSPFERRLLYTVTIA